MDSRQRRSDLEMLEGDWLEREQSKAVCVDTLLEYRVAETQLGVQRKMYNILWWKC